MLVLIASPDLRAAVEVRVSGGRVDVQATNAPRLRGMSDWYLATQLKHFRDGVRGGHPQDAYGSQMALFAAMLRDDQSILDLLAYVDTLPAAGTAGTKK